MKEKLDLLVEAISKKMDTFPLSKDFPINLTK